MSVIKSVHIIHINELSFYCQLAADVLLTLSSCSSSPHTRCHNPQHQPAPRRMSFGLSVTAAHSKSLQLRLQPEFSVVKCVYYGQCWKGSDN